MNHITLKLIPEKSPETCDGCVFGNLKMESCIQIRACLGADCRGNIFVLAPECVYNSQLQRDGELVRPERCQGCDDYDYQVSVTPSCRRQVCRRPDPEERVRYSMQKIILTDRYEDRMETIIQSRPSVLDRLRKWRVK